MAYRLDYEDGSVVLRDGHGALHATSCSSTSSSGRRPSPATRCPTRTREADRRCSEGVVRLCEDADVVIYDTQFTPEEYRQRPHWGHSTARRRHRDRAAAGAKQAGALPPRSHAHRRAARRDRASTRPRPRHSASPPRCCPPTSSCRSRSAPRSPRARRSAVWDALMEVTFWGVRGSIPAPGPETNRYGGNTSCVTVKTSAGRLIVIDMGTGIRGLGATLMGGPFGKGQGRRGDPPLARPLGPHPGLPVLPAGLRASQPLRDLRPRRARTTCSRASSRAR